jgi:hypothetical protein
MEAGEKNRQASETEERELSEEAARYIASRMGRLTMGKNTI